MEKTRNSVIDLFKNFGFAISKLVNGGEVDDVELTGELAKDPIDALKEYEASVMAKSVEEPVKTRTRAKAQTREVSAQTLTVKTKQRTSKTIRVEENDEREI